MRKPDYFLSVPGHLPIRQAAERLGVSPKRVLQHIYALHLPADKVQGRWLIPEAAVESFSALPHGRIRKDPVQWLHYKKGARVFIRDIVVPICRGREDALATRLALIAKKQQHCFPGTMQRFLFIAAGKLHVVLVWKDIEIDLDVLERDLERFKVATMRMVAWSHARDETAEAAAHT